MPARLLFLCARGSGRALLAASLLHDVAASRFEVWGTPPQNAQEQTLVEDVLHERTITLLPTERLIQPQFGLQWDEGIILCSGMTET